MKEIKMVDLNSQHAKIIDEINASIEEVVKSSSFIRGEHVSKFQSALSEYLDVPFVIPCGNGTDALQVAFMALNLQPGDEVITTTFTFISTVEVIRLLGLKPVLCDVDPNTFNLDTAKLKKLITSRSMAILPVHLFGQCADMSEINRLAMEHGLFVIEDAAQSLGTWFIFPDGRKKRAGTLGTIGCTSFFPSKNLGAWGDGGAIFTENKAYADKMSAIVNHGMVKKYYYELIGLNSRLDTLQAAILLVKLKYLDDYLVARKKAASFYDAHLQGHPLIQIPERSHWTDHTFHQYTIKVSNGRRNELKEYLRIKNIPSMIYYPSPFHTQKAYLELGYVEGDFPVTEDLCKCVLSLPMHTELDEAQLSYICNTINEFS